MGSDNNRFGTGMRRREFVAGLTAGGLIVPAMVAFNPATARAQEPQKGGTLKLGLGGGATTDSLDPALSSNTVTFVLAHIWGDRLVNTDPETGEVVPSLAESWAPGQDGAEWRFKLREGVRFHDGSPLTVADAVATLKRHADAESQSGALGMLTSLTEITEEGGELVIRLDAPNADLPAILTDYHLQIQPNGGADDPTAAIGTGPYKLVNAEAGVRYIFEKNQEDWDSSRGHVDSVELLVMNDATARIAAISSGQVHYIDNVEVKTVSLLERAPTVEILQTPGKGYYSFLALCDTAPFDNNDLRMALKLALDRETMLKQVMGGFGTLGNDYPVNAAYALAPEDIPQRSYDPEAAAEYYRKSGHEGEIVLHTASVAFTGAIDAAVLFQQSAAEAGITIRVQREPDDGYFTNVWNAKPFCASYWGGRPTQDLRYSTSFVSDADWNDTNFRDENFDRMVADARAELDEEKRRSLYRDIAMTVRDEGGAIIPAFNDYIGAGSTRMKGFVHDIAHDVSNGQIAARVWLES